MKTSQFPAIVVALFIAAAIAVPTSASAQSINYSDAWSEDYETEAEHADAWWWGIGYTDCDNCYYGQMTSVKTWTESVTPSAQTMQLTYEEGTTFAISGLWQDHDQSHADGQYSLHVTHEVYAAESGNYELLGFADGSIPIEIKLKGQNRYVYDHFEDPDRWVYRRDDCNSSCQTETQYVNASSHPGQYLRRNVSKIKIFFVKKCFRAKLTPQSYRGTCSE